MLRSLLKEPLAHFLALALIIFAVYAGLNSTESRRPDRVVVSQSKIEQLANYFALSWRKAPNTEELKGLIDDYIKEEIYYREALALGLDKNDTIIRRRLRIKMEFLSQAEAEGLVPTESELLAYLRDNPSKFEIEPQIAFQHVYLSPARRGKKIDEDAASLRLKLIDDATIDPGSLGDPTLLPSELPITGTTSIAQMFGLDFSKELIMAVPGQWVGPIKSAFGLHIVRVLERKPGHIPDLSEVRNAVARDWSNERRKLFEQARLNQLLKRYQVSIESLPAVKTDR